MFRERAGLTKAEVARRVGTTRQQIGRLEEAERKLSLEWAKKLAPVLKCTAQELMFPELAAVDTNRFTNVYEIDLESEASPNPSLALENDFIRRLVPGALGHNLRLIVIDTDHSGGRVAKGDAVVIDTALNTPARSGLYAIEIGGTLHWRYLTPTTTGHVSVQGEDASAPAELVEPASLKIIGRARLRISTI